MNDVERRRRLCEAILPPGVQRVDGEAPSRPECFDDGYVLPVHSVKPLQLLHAHEKDQHLVFYEKPHVYTWRGVPTTASVTALAHKYERPFDPVKAIASMKMSRGQAWPRFEYVLDAQPLDADWEPSRGTLLVSSGKTVASLRPGAMHEGTMENVKTILHACCVKTGGDSDEEFFSFARELSEQEIRDKWNAKGKRASHLGTEAHYQSELFMNGLPCRLWEPEMGVLADFVETMMIPRGIVAFATETEKVCPDADLAGSIDLIVYEPSTGLHHIIDFKRSDKLKQDLRGYGKMIAPFDHLDDCKGAAYALQLSAYQYILEREYGMHIGDRILLSLHPDAPFYTSVPYMKAEVEFLMNDRFGLVKARREVQRQNPDRFTCSLTGAPMVDAVRLEDGTLAMERAVQVRELPFTIDSDVRETFEMFVALHRIEGPCALPAADRVSWRKRMPEAGIVPFA